MLTKASSIARNFTLELWYKFQSINQFPDGVLTKRDVLQRLLHEDNWHTKNAVQTVSNELFDIWIQSNVYPISLQAISQRIFKLANEFQKIQHYPTTKKGAAFEKRVNDLTKNIDELYNVFNKNEQQRKKLEKTYKLRMNESDWNFYHDQCGLRIGKCYLIKEKYTESDLKFISRVNQEISNKDLQDQPSSLSSRAATALDYYSDDAASTSDSSEFSPPAKRPNIQNRQSLTNLALMCERFDVSDRAGAAIASAVLKDFGVSDNGNLADVIDRSKLRRERQKYRQKLRDEEECNFEIVDAIYVDGREDVTLTTIEIEDSRFYPKVETEEHYVVVGEPGEMYLTHLSVEDGKGTTIGQALYKAIENTDLQNTLSTIGSDGTPIMTGKHHGSIATLEELLQRSLQWAICLLHTNELPLRHVFKHLGGVSASPDSFSGPIGKELNGLVSDWKVVNFRPLSSIEFPYLPQEVIQNLSSD